MKTKPHFVANLKYLKSEEGGRLAPATSGYRPGIKFPFYAGFFSGIQTFIGKDTVISGENIEAEITLLDTNYFKGKLCEGMKFEFYEGSILIGNGIITKLLKT